jgi:hypothetical protein
MRRIPILLLLLLLAACGDDSGTGWTSTTPVTAPSTSTTAGPDTTGTTGTTIVTTTSETTTTAAPTTTVAPTTTAATQYTIDTATFLPPVFGAAGDPNGSGCILYGDVLLDGVWFGFAKAVSNGVITFDLGCFFTGAAADAAANADYGGTDGAEEGFHIRNQNPKTFPVTIAPTAQVYYVDQAGPTWFPELIPLASWPSTTSWLPCPGDSCAVWLYVNGGQATGIVEQYLP